MTTLVEPAQGLTEVNQLLDEGQALQLRLHELGNTLRSIAGQLEAGIPPSAGLAASVIEVSKAFENWQERSKQALGEGSLEAVLPQISRRLEGHKSSLEQAQLKKQALLVLEQVSSLVYRGNEEFLPLSTIQFDALGMMRSTKDAPQLSDATLSLADGSHPFCQLLRLICDADMSNEAWDSVYKVVGDALGPELAVAAVRSKIYLPE